MNKYEALFIFPESMKDEAMEASLGKIREEIEKAEGKVEGRAEGMRLKALEDARKLVEHGVSWEIITSATGIKPEDLTVG